MDPLLALWITYRKSPSSEKLKGREEENNSGERREERVRKGNEGRREEKMLCRKE